MRKCLFHRATRRVARLAGVAGGLVLGAVSVAALAQNDSAPEGDAASGRTLAESQCARCHVVGDFNPTGGIGSTPSFRLLTSLADYQDRFRSFYVRRPHPVFVRLPDVDPLTDLPPNAAVFQISLQDIEDLMAFVETLR